MLLGTLEVREGQGGGGGSGPGLGREGGGGGGGGGVLLNRQPTWVAQHQRVLLKVFQQHHVAFCSRQILTPLCMQNSMSKAHLLVC